jgi:hypothetical protein
VKKDADDENALEFFGMTYEDGEGDTVYADGYWASPSNDTALNTLLTHTYIAGGFTTRSDTARRQAEAIAEAACKGLITTQTPDGFYSSVWRLTAIGLHELGLRLPQLEMKQ